MEKIVINFRVAKCGTRSLLWILKTLGPKLGYHLEITTARAASDWNVQAESEDEVMSEVNKIIKAQKNSFVRARHYSFIDLKKRGLDWSLEWLGIVRDPIERVITIKSVRHLHSTNNQNVYFFSFSPGIIIEGLRFVFMEPNLIILVTNWPMNFILIQWICHLNHVFYKDIRNANSFHILIQMIWVDTGV